tara:strand:+ start:656 stop:919 length:264 start_codon:yes stop_codon:yes gene_type:complete
MNWNDNDGEDWKGENPWESWGDMMKKYNGMSNKPNKPDYPEPPPEKPSTKELTNNLLDALIIALKKGNKEEIEAIKNELELLLTFNK